MLNIEVAALQTITGGAAVPDQSKLRALAKQYCPGTAAKFGSAKTITRPMAEVCLDEAHMGWAKGQLDQYFPKTK